MAKKRSLLKKTVLDGELVYLASTAKKTATRRGPVPLAAVAAKRLAMASDVSIKASELVTLKLVSKTSQQEDLAKWVKKEGGKIVSQVEHGEVFVVDLPVTSVGKLDRIKHLQRAEASRVLLPRMDKARGQATGLDSAVNAHSLTGDGVVFGIIDTGLDWKHPDFQDTNGDTRLELFTHAFVPSNSDVSKFQDFNEGKINDALAGTQEVPPGDKNGHGTHCASIAAGNGQSSGGKFRGVAPNAALMAMRSEPLLDTHTIRGIRKFFELAGDRPAVVSLSLGGHIGAHDGTSAIENVISRECGPGSIVVVAAGNEGEDGVHWQGQLVENEVTTIPVRVTDQELQVTDVWIPRSDEVEVEIEAPDGSRFDPDGVAHETVFGTFLADLRTDPVNRDQNATLRMVASPNFIWKIRIIAKKILHGEVHAWGHSNSESNASQFFPGFTDPGYSVGMPGTEERAIVVGSYVSRNAFNTNNGNLTAAGLDIGQLSNFSSHGPSRIGVQKPDIAAPGQYITAALAENSHLSSSPDYIPRHHPTKGYITIQGTSMSTPFVAGVIALMLEREPNLTPEEIQKRLRATARRDSDTQRVWSPGFGYGKIDVEALLNYEA